MNKALKALREEQKNELVRIQNQHKLLQADLDIAWQFLPENHTIEQYCSIVKPVLTKVEELEKQIKFLNTELIEKKYANNLGYSDVFPYEVIEEKTPKCYLIRPMDAVETEESIKARFASFVPGGFCGRYDNSVQDWKITSNEIANTFTIRLHKDGYWYDAFGNKYVIENSPRKFYDFNF